MDVFAPAIERAAALFDKAMEGFEEKAPVKIGGFSVEKPEEVFVIESPQAVTYTSPATSTMAMDGRARGLYHVEFQVAMQVWAVRADVWEASKLVLSWFEAFAREVARDRTLGGTVTNCTPFISETGSAARSTRNQYIAALSGGVRVTADVDPLC